MSSLSRTIYILPPPPGGVGPNGSIRSNTQLVWPAKNPGDTEDFTLDASAFLGSDTIIAGSVAITSISPADVTASAPTVTATAMTWFFSGGTVTNPITQYLIVVNFSTAAGVTVSRQVYLPIVPSAGPPGLGNGVVTVVGPPGVSVASITQPAGSGTALFTLSNGVTQTVILPPGAAGTAGVGVASITQPGGPGTAVFTLSNGTTQPITLPPGAAGVGISSISQPSGPGSASILLSNGTTQAITLPPGLTGPPGATATGGTPAGAWTPASNSPSLATGGLLNGTLATPGSLLTIGGTIGGTVTLGTAIDGITSAVQGDQMLQAGTSWLYIPRSTNGNFQNVAIANNQMVDNLDNTFGWHISDNRGYRYLTFDLTHGLQTGLAGFTTATIGTLNVTTFNGPPPSVASTAGDTLLFTNPISGQTTLPGMTQSVGRSNFLDIGLVNGAVGFSFNLLTGSLYCAGGVTSSGTATGAFAQTDINASENAVVAQNAADRVPFTGVMPPSSNYNVIYSFGPSESVGTDEVPALPMPSWPGGVVTVGLAPRGIYFNPNSSHLGTFVGAGDNLLHNAVSQNQSATSGAIYTVRTGTVTITGASVTSLGSGTIVMTGTCSPAMSSVFAAGDAYFAEGFVNATANNYNAPGVTKQSNFFQVLSATSNSITASVGSTFSVTGSAEASVILSQYTVAGQGGAGEDPVLTAAIDYRAAQLLSAGLIADPVHQIVPANCGVASQQISAFIPGATPNLAGTAVGHAQALVSAAGTGTCSALALLTLFGGPDYTQGNTKAAIKTAALAVYDGFVATVATGVFAQPLPPLWGINVYAGPALCDYDASGTDPMPAANAQLELCGMAPARGITTPARPGAICVGNAIMAQNHGEHQDSNGGIQYGSQIGKVLWAAQKGYRVPYITQPLIRANQILVPIAGLTGKLIARAVFSNGFLVNPSTLGLSVTDSTIPIVTQSGGARTNQNPYGFYGGGLAITQAQIVGPATVLLTLAATPTGTNLLLWNADASVHGGLTGLCDSDTHNSVRAWSYTRGSGQSPFNNLPGPVSVAQPVSNGQFINTWQAVQPCAIPIIAG